MINIEKQLRINTQIKKIRELLGLSQSVFAEELNLQRNSISLIENGKRNPSERTINDICNKFNVNKKYLISGEGEPFTVFSDEEELGSYIADLIDSDSDIAAKTLKSAIIAYGRLSEDSKKIICEYLESLYEILNKDLNSIKELKDTAFL